MTSISLVWGPALGVGGTEQRMTEAAAHLVRLGHRVDSWFPPGSRDSALHHLMESSGADVHFVPSAMIPMKHLRGPDVVVAMGFRASITARMARVLARGHWPLIDARNGLEYGRAPVIWRVDRLTQRVVTRYVCNSEAAASELRRHGIHDDRVQVVPSALGERWLRRARVSRDPNLVLMVGNARPEKNQLFGLKAVQAAASPGVRVRVYTDDASSLSHAWAEVPGNEEVAVEYVEGIRVTPEIMASAGVLLHPSVSESLPRTVLEAVSQGTWVVVSDVGDSRAAVAGAGHVVPVGDLEAFVTALEESFSAARSGEEPSRRDRVRGVDEYCHAFVGAVGVSL